MYQTNKYCGKVWKCSKSFYTKYTGGQSQTLPQNLLPMRHESWAIIGQRLIKFSVYLTRKNLNAYYSPENINHPIGYPNPRGPKCLMMKGPEGFLLAFFPQRMGLHEQRPPVLQCECISIDMESSISTGVLIEVMTHNQICIHMVTCGMCMHIGWSSTANAAEAKAEGLTATNNTTVKRYIENPCQLLHMQFLKSQMKMSQLIVRASVLQMYNS